MVMNWLALSILMTQRVAFAVFSHTILISALKRTICFRRDLAAAPSSLKVILACLNNASTLLKRWFVIGKYMRVRLIDVTL